MTALTDERIGAIYREHYPDSWMADGSLRKFARAIEAEVLAAAPAEPPKPVPAGWRIETRESLFGPYRWACLRHLESQCGLDFYEDSEPMMFAFLMALASPTVTIDGPEAARGDGGEG